MVTVSPPVRRIPPGYLRLKAVLDFLLAIVLLIGLGWLLILAALLIKLESKGPIIFRQERVGKDGLLFILFKFRSMRTDAPNVSTEELRRLGIDPITRFGRLLRKTSVDELPQLFNILRGEMSFIGPRPALPSQTDVNTLRHEMGVHAVRPGISGLAQVMGRDDLDTGTKVRYDAEYCDNISLAFDLKLFWLTFATIFTGRGNK
jgi:O-antigen biosynthesis protein WbqP